MLDFDNHDEVQQAVENAMDIERDNRLNVREAHKFVTNRNGQWEEQWYNNADGKPRYQFDMTSPVINAIAGDISQKSFSVDIKPTGDASSEDTAKIIDGMVRNIESISNASDTYDNAAVDVVTAGLAGWEVVQKYVDDNSFDQDLVISPLLDFGDRVWFDPSAKMQDKSDAKWAVKLTSMDPNDYEKKWPEGAAESVSKENVSNSGQYKAELITVGRIYWIKQKDRDLVKMSDGSILPDDDKFEAIAAQLAEQGITEERRRKRPDDIVFARDFDGADWLDKEKETVFSRLPLIPVYANYKIIEDKPLYFGVVEKLMDRQRVFNYAKSREIEEGAFASRAKYWMTQLQAEGHESQLQTLNSNSDPVQFYNADGEAPGVPQQQGGAVINQGLVTLSASMKEGMSEAIGMFAAGMGDNPGLQSGIAIEMLQDKGSMGTRLYSKAMEIAICATGRVIVDALPRAYDAKRVVRILGEDGKADAVEINKPVTGSDGQPVTLNNLTAGKYNVTCTMGPSFSSKQSETVAAITEISGVDPSIIGIGSDVLLNNISAPGMDIIASRKRKQLFEGGAIPQDEWTDEEQQVMQAQSQQPQQPDPSMIMAQAELQKAQAEMAKVQQRDKDSELNARLKLEEMDQKRNKDEVSAILQQQKLIVENINTMADTLKVLREAMGVDSIVGPNAQQAFIQQAQAITIEQNESL